MTQTSYAERRIASLISRYADGAPADVDPTAMAWAAVSVRQPRFFESLRFGWLASRPGLVIAVLVLIAALVGAMVAGSQVLRRDPAWEPVAGVPPFLGLAPAGVAASVPEHGEVVLRFEARMPALGMEAQQSFLYADGRLIWQRNLEGSERAQAIFGDLEPTQAVIEQRLTAEGVSLVRANVLASGAKVGGGGRPGTQPWGGIELVVDGRLQEISWTDVDLPERLADPGSWLPEAAWFDRELRGYVPSRYAVCLGPELQMSDMPPAAVQLLRVVGPGNPSSIGTCYAVETSTAREISSLVEVARFRRCDAAVNLAYSRPSTEDCWYDGLSFSEILPDGALLLRGG